MEKSIVQLPTANIISKAFVLQALFLSAKTQNV